MAIKTKTKRRIYKWEVATYPMEINSILMPPNCLFIGIPAHCVVKSYASSHAQPFRCIVILLVGSTWDHCLSSRHSPPHG